MSVILALVCPSSTRAQSDTAAEIGQIAPFRLTALDDAAIEVRSNDDFKFTVVCFLGTECPLARLYAPRLAELAQQFSPKGVRFIGIDSNQQDSADELRKFAAEFKLGFPVAKDEKNALADKFQAERMSEVLILNSALAVRYRGRIDDRYRPGITRTHPEIRDDLRIALEELLAGKTVSVPRTTVSGCLIGRVKQTSASPKVTFSRDVARVLQRNCVECHRAGEIGPFALTDYDEVVGWADTILEVVEAGRMPPWHADPRHGEFANARHMPEDDKQVLRDWVAAGAPPGDKVDLPPPLPPAKTWQLARDPDLVIGMRERAFDVPPEGTVEYQYFVVDPGFAEDKWITGAQVLPGNRSVVHHALIFVRPPDVRQFRGSSWLAAYVPGQRAAMLPPGHGRHVPAGSKLVFQMHYTPNGSQQSDLTRVALLFGDESKITHEVFSQIGLEQEFEIPPYAKDYSVTVAPRRLSSHGKLLAVAPHMHLRGKSFRLITRSEGNEKILLDVPRYDFNWQHVYAFAEPLPLESIGSLQFRATFDNSTANPVNPDPTQHVTWGDQTWEEMAVAFFEISVPRESGGKSEQEPTVTAADAKKRQTKITQFAANFLRRFDTNEDGQIDRAELPLATERFGFQNLDENQDGRLTRTEVERAAAQRGDF
jgi:thiol-disulfide isomerase/thioredoxin